MAVSESQSPANLRGIPNFYRVMFFLSFVVLILLPLSILSSAVWLEYRAKRLDAGVSALERELASLSQDIAADSNAVAAADAEVAEVARAGQAVAEGGSDRSTLWNPDARWSEMGKARVLELWGRRGILQDRLSRYHTQTREKTVKLQDVRARKDQNAYLRESVRNHAFVCYATLLAGLFSSVLFALLWGALVQTKVNAILKRWAHRS